MSKVAKKLFFDLDGIGRINARAGGTFNPGGSNRSEEIADTGVVGFSEEPVAASISCTIPNDGTVGMDVLRDLTDINVTVQDDNGQMWIVSGCFTTEPPGVSNGDITLNMKGRTADRVS